MALTFFFAVIGWIIFRAESMTQAIDYLTAMITNQFYDPSIHLGGKYFCLALLIIEWLQRDKQHALQFPNIRPFKYRIVRWGIYYLILLAIAKFTGTTQTFIYFQF